MYLGVVGLQSSINEADSLGLASLCTLYGTFIFSGLYTSSVHLFGTKYTLIVSYIGMSLYTLLSTLVYFDTWISVCWNCIWTFVGFTQYTYYYNSNSYAPALKENSAYLVSLFTGILTMLSYIPSNLASSVILLNGRDQNNSILDASLGDIYAIILKLPI